MTVLRLESIDPAQNRYRLCQWGRLDQAPRGLRGLEAGDRDAAAEALAGIVRLRERHGYRMKQPPH